jgi:hypothetical protein
VTERIKKAVEAPKVGLDRRKQNMNLSDWFLVMFKLSMSDIKQYKDLYIQCKSGDMEKGPFLIVVDCS